jgi:hypothetical protein
MNKMHTLFFILFVNVFITGSSDIRLSETISIVEGKVEGGSFAHDSDDDLYGKEIGQMHFGPDQLVALYGSSFFTDSTEHDEFQVSPWISAKFGNVNARRKRMGEEHIMDETQLGVYKGWEKSTVPIMTKIDSDEIENDMVHLVQVYDNGYYCRLGASYSAVLEFQCDGHLLTSNNVDENVVEAVKATIDKVSKDQDVSVRKNELELEVELDGYGDIEYGYSDSITEYEDAILASHEMHMEEMNTATTVTDDADVKTYEKSDIDFRVTNVVLGDFARTLHGKSSSHLSAWTESSDGCTYRITLSVPFQCEGMHLSVPLNNVQKYFDTQAGKDNSDTIGNDLNSDDNNKEDLATLKTLEAWSEWGLPMTKTDYSSLLSSDAILDSSSEAPTNTRDSSESSTDSSSSSSSNIENNIANENMTEESDTNDGSTSKCSCCQELAELKVQLRGLAEALAESKD